MYNTSIGDTSIPVSGHLYDMLYFLPISSIVMLHPRNTLLRYLDMLSSVSIS